MAKIIAPREAQALVAKDDIQIVDVREPHEWATGHVPNARLIPLGELCEDWEGSSVQGKVLFVCESGGRSAKAAALAESHGLTEVYSLEGGTSGWATAGLPIVHPKPKAPSSQTLAARAKKASEPPAASQTSELDPELDAVVSKNFRELRAQRGYTLDVLAGLSGVGRQTLGQIEIGHAVPSIGTLWKIARAFDVPFSVLLARPTSKVTHVLRAAGAQRITGADGRFSSRALFTPEQKGTVEFYELWLAGHGREDADAHAPGTRENLVITSGNLVLELGSERFELGRGDSIVFAADVPHAYVNLKSEECWMNLVMTYTA